MLAGVVSLLSKQPVRPVATNHVFAQYLWWGPSILGHALAYVVILFGAFRFPGPSP